MNVLVTGSSGWIGSNLSKALLTKEHAVVRTSRANAIEEDVLNIDMLSADWNFTLDNIDTVVHCAAIAQADGVSDEQDQRDFWTVNVDASKKLAKKAKQDGVKRFIFLSSIKAMGESTKTGDPFDEKSQCIPEDLYGESKLAAEHAIRQELLGSNTEFVCIRPPLVYGAGVKGNFRALMNLAKRNIPLPFGAIVNKRSFIAIENLIDFIIVCIEYSEVLNDTFLISDGDDKSTTDLLVALKNAYGNNANLLPIPVWLMRSCATILGKKTIADRLFDNLQLDITRSTQVLNWTPVVTFEDAIASAVAYDASK